MKILISLRVACVGLLLALAPVRATTIDIMLVFDTTAKAWADTHRGGIQLFAADAVGRMNQAMGNSGVDLTFTLVHAAHLSHYTYGGGGLADALVSMQSGSGAFSDVHVLRDQHAADLVALLVDTGSSFGNVGVAYLLTSLQGQPTHAFSANAIRSVDISHTLTHEVGHNLGTHHAYNQSQSPGPNSALNAYSAGYYFSGSTDGLDYHTIMAYNYDGSMFYRSAPLFSSPLRSYQGTVAGHASLADNARTIRETMGTVANYRTPSVLSLSPTSRSHVSAVSSGHTITVTSSASWSATASASWITITGGSSGSGNGTVAYSLAANTATSTRNGTIVVSGGGVSRTFSISQSGESVSLGDALNAPTLTWTTGGHADWFAQSETTRDGLAAQSGAITHNQQSWLQTTVTGPGTISFWWKVSSEANYDSLRFLIGGVEQQRISGNVDWQQRSFSVPSGSHTLRWQYDKDFSIDSGADCGWLDQVSWTQSTLSIDPLSRSHSSESTGGHTIAVTANTSWEATTSSQWITITSGSSGSGDGSVAYSLAVNNTTSTRGGTIVVHGGGETRTFTIEQAGQSSLPDFIVASLSVSPSPISVGGDLTATVVVKNQGGASGDGGFLDVWYNRASAVPDPSDGEYDAWVAVGNLTTGQSRTFTFAFQAPGPAGTKTFRAFVDSEDDTAESSRAGNQISNTYTVTDPGSGASLGEALNAPSLPWTTGGHADWFTQSQTTRDGLAAQSGAITHNQESWLQTTVTGPGTIGFSWKVSSENTWDWLRFLIGSTVYAQISGNVDWQQRSFFVPAGTHMLTWIYIKDGSISVGSDAGWVDQVVWAFQPAQRFDSTQLVSGLAVNRWSFMTAWNLATGSLAVSPRWWHGVYTWEHAASGHQQWIARFTYDESTGRTTSLAWYYRQSHVQ